MNKFKNIFDKLKLTDKTTKHSYHLVYDDLLKPFVNKGVNFLEIGLYKGECLLGFEEFLVDANIYGTDIQFNDLLSDIKNSSNYNLSMMDSTNKLLVEKNFKDNFFDIIIDDGSHFIYDQLITFINFYKKLKKCATYVIEDVEPNSLELFHELNLFEIIDNRHLPNSVFPIRDKHGTVVGFTGEKRLDEIVCIFKKETIDEQLTAKIEKFINQKGKKAFATAAGKYEKDKRKKRLESINWKV
tara:strand:- start:1269 stop:1994 length:726 start_codon:yes stop_codon:yes gene_type:complete